MSWDLHQLTKSSTDIWVDGICGGLGEHTPVPAWIWRAGFTVLAFAGGAGMIAYGVLWVFMPRADDQHDDTETA